MSSTDDSLARHQYLLDHALEAIRTRAYYSAYPESPSPRYYGDNAAAEGKAAYEALLDTDLPLHVPGSEALVQDEVSPFGFALNVRYPQVTEDDLDELLSAAQAGIPAWRDAGAEVRVDVCLTVLDRLHRRVFELANAVRAVTGQGFVMAFQGMTHALDRALEAIAYAYVEMTRHPSVASWVKPAREGALRVEKTFTVVPRGVALVVGCSTFPTWNGYPGLFASLVTGNAVVVKPHPQAVLPLAITVQVCQEVLASLGYDPALVTLAAEHAGDDLAKDLATRPEVRIVDYTGSTEFGLWLEEHARQARVYTEKSGVNGVVVDSTSSFAGMCANLAFTISLYSGQMCTSAQNLYVPSDGIDTDEGHKSFEDVIASLAAALDTLLGDDARAAEVLGALVNEAVINRVELVQEYGEVALESRSIAHPEFPDAVVRTPALVVLEGEDLDAFSREVFGPVVFVVRTSSSLESAELVRKVGMSVGSMTAGVYSTSPEVLASVRSAALDAGVALSENPTGTLYLNQAAAFSDYHGTGANPAANASFTDGAFVAGRFHVVQSRRPVS
ncbi:phenylacetic acid degradation protein PaaN [Tenggerimyces flavus]|uniref:Phenylacetic acid degradation protein PaaN n=1 Tax=Tenggerimyces flavus TaxID=1708749 RepID=A0ABV7YII8_9ACTN|nr:phenylacetic acid degradation protein PaaN [Tenggerimyces flavus]MBM7784202.1 phenylacetic acid degradation protein paaN [Tenggerimyces flavus]